MTSIKDQDASVATDISVEQLAAALIRANLPETENIFRIAGSKVIESDDERHIVASKLADISREKKHQLRDVIKQLNQDMGGLDRSIINCLVFMNRATECWQSQSPLDPFVKKSVMRRRYILAALLLDQPEFVLDTGHPVNEIMALVEKLFMGWEEEKGQPPTFVMKSLNALTRLLDADHCLIREEQDLARRALFESWEKEKKRRHMLEQRLIQTEMGLDNVWYAQHLAVSSINKFAQGKQLPPEVIQFLQGDWLDSMRLVILSKGDESKEFQRIFKLTDRIVFTYRGQHSPSQKQRMYDYAGQLIDEVQHQLPSLDQKPDQKESVLSALQDIILKIVKEQDVPRNDYLPMVTELNEEQQDPELESRLAEQCGNWFRRNGRLCQLVAVLPRQKAILWSDFSGRKVALEPAGEFYRELQQDQVSPFTASGSMQGIFQNVARELVETDLSHRVALQKKLDEERSIRAAAKAKAEAEAEAIVKAREEAQRRQEEERLALEQRMRQQAIEAEERAALEAESQAKEAIDGLKIGGWVSFENNGKTVRAKLGVRFNATGRLVFVDEFGMKMAELMRDEAVQLILKSEFKFLGADAELEERLGRAVGRIGIAKR